VKTQFNLREHKNGKEQTKIYIKVKNKKNCKISSARRKKRGERVEAVLQQNKNTSGKRRGKK